jgi:hypothetical protein
LDKKWGQVNARWDVEVLGRCPWRISADDESALTEIVGASAADLSVEARNDRRN